MAKRLNWSVDLALFDLSILVVLISGPQALPRELALKQIQNHVSGTFEVISSALFDAQVSVGRGISSCSSETLLVSVWDVLIGRGILPSLGKTKIDQVKGLRVVLHAYQDVLGL